MPIKLKVFRVSLICCCLLLTYLLSVPGVFAAAVSATPSVPLRVGYQPIASPTGSVFEVMKRDQLLRKELMRHNITLAFVPYKKGIDSVLAFKRGELELVALGDLPMIEFALSTPIVIFSQIRLGFSTVVAQRGTMPRDLKGKRIGNIFASAGHYALLKTLQNGGLTERDVTLVPLEVNEMTGAMLQGKIDAFSAWEPTPSLFIAQHPDRFSSVGRQLGSGYLTVSRTFAARHSGSVALLAAAQARAMQWLAKDRANLLQAAIWQRTAIQQLSEMPVTVSAEELSRKVAADLQVLRFSARLPALKNKDKNLLADEFMFLKGLGKLPQSAQWETIRASFDHSIMDQIYKKPKASLLKRFEYDLR